MGVPNGYTSAQVVQAVPTGINSGLVLVKTQTIGTTVSSVTVSGAFSSTYDNYLVIVSDGVASTATRLLLSLGATSTGYYFWGVYNTYTVATLGKLHGSNVAAFDEVVGISQNSNVGVFNVIAPNLAKRTAYNAAISVSGTSQYGAYTSGYLDNDTQYTDFTLTTGTGTVTGGTIRVYGYANS